MSFIGRSVDTTELARPTRPTSVTHYWTYFVCGSRNHRTERECEHVRTDAVAVLPQPAQAATLGPIQTLTCLLLAGAGEPHRIAIEQKGSCQQHRVRVLHRVASEERGLPNATACGHLAASLQRAHVGMLRAHLADPSEQRSCRRRPSKLLWPTVLSPARAQACQPALRGLCAVAHVGELVAPSVVIIFAAATL